MTKESKVVAWQWRSPHMIAANEPPNVTDDEALIARVNGQGWEVEGLVTHADYRALEEELAALRGQYEQVRQCCMDETVRATRLMGDLDELRGNVGDSSP